MGNLFNNLQSKLFDTVETVFGDDVTWEPSTSGGPYTCRCLFKDPNESKKFVAVAGQEYQPMQPVMEYRDGDLPGLYTAVREGANETVVINGGATYYVKEVNKAWDGKTYQAKLELIP